MINLAGYLNIRDYWPNRISGPFQFLKADNNVATHFEPLLFHEYWVYFVVKKVLFWLRCKIYENPSVHDFIQDYYYNRVPDFLIWDKIVPIYLKVNEFVYYYYLSGEDWRIFPQRRRYLY